MNRVHNTLPEGNVSLFVKVSDLLNLFLLVLLIFAVRGDLLSSVHIVEMHLIMHSHRSCWTPPFFHKSTLTPCPSPPGHGLCAVFSELTRRHNGVSGAWDDFSSFELGQLRLVDDFPTRSLICAVLDIA
jgi:hypothetical protein